MEKELALKDDVEMLEALNASIKVWEGKTEITDSECPLCTLGRKRRNSFYNDTCDYCIIKKRTGQSHCQGTPYHRDKDKPFPEYKQNMISYLKSFLPEERKTIKMRKVVIRNKDLNTVNIGDVSNNKVYGYRFGNSNSNTRILRRIDDKYRWIMMDDSMTVNTFFDYKKTASLTEAIKEVQEQWPSVTIYEFNNMNEFYKWAMTKK